MSTSLSRAADMGRGIGKPTVRDGETAARPLWQTLAGWLPHFAAMALAASVGVVLAVTPVGSGDYGQWLMVSRFYQGLDVPAYREVASVPPLMPASLAALRFAISDPILSLQVYKALLGAAFVLSYYVAGLNLFQRKAAGLLSAVFAFLVSDRLMELFAFGGMPQILALIFLALAVAAFARGKNAPGLETRWWVLGTVCLGLAMLSHMGTGIIAVLSGVGVALLSALGNRNLGMRQRIEALTPLCTGLLLLGIYYAVVLLPANRAYASNPASLNYRGPEMIWNMLTAYRPGLLALLIGGAFVLGGVAFDAIGRRQIGGFALVGAWALGAWGFLGLSIAQQSATDYPRFTAPLAAPLIVAAGGGLALAAGAIVSGMRNPWHGIARNAIALIAAAVLALGIGPTTLKRHAAEARGYDIGDRAALLDMAAFLDADLPEGQGILAPTREGKWIEGLTGRPALFQMPVRYSFRAVERERDINAKALVQSTASMTNEYFFVQFVDGEWAGSYLVPQQPRIAINHRGEFVDVVRIMPEGSRVLAEDGMTTLATMANLPAAQVEARKGEDMVMLRGAWAGDRSGETISYSRTIAIGRGSTGLDVIDEVTTPLAVGGLEVSLIPIQDNPPEQVDLGPDGVDLYYSARGKTRPHLRISAPDVDAEFRVEGNAVVVRAAGVRQLHIRVSSTTPAEPIAELRLVDPYQALSGLNLGAVILKNDPATSARKERLATLGFVREENFGPYLVLLRGR